MTSKRFCKGLSRRELIASTAAFGTAIVASAQQRRPGRIDVHHHIGPPPSFAGRGGGGGPWSPEIAIQEMDRNGVATGVGFPGPIPFSTDIESARKLAREYNEYGAKIKIDHPGRFGLFAALPMFDVEGTLKEIEYSLNILKTDGFGISTSYGDMWLGDAKLRPIFEELHRRKAVVYVHPNDAPCCTPRTLTYEQSPISGAWIEWPMNTARTILSLIQNGHTRQFANVRFIFSHGGGVMPLLLSRIAGFTDWPAVGPEELREMFPDGIEAEFRKLYFEGAQAYDPVNFEALRKLVPTSHVLFGTDYNRFPITHSVSLFDKLNLSPGDRRLIERDNAIALLPGLRNSV